MKGALLSLMGLVLSCLLGLSPLPYLANCIGATESALKLLLSIYMSYLIAWTYQKYIKATSRHIRHIYLFGMGLGLAFFNFGYSMYHNLVPTMVMYITMNTLPGKINCIVTFIFNMAYLLIGYVMTESEEYDITWTMPQCVLTLKLIALSFDLWDGEKLKADATGSEKKTALYVRPTLIELLGFVYFPSCFLVGPIFTFWRYHDFVNDMFPLEDSHIYEPYALKKLAMGTAYLVAHQVGVNIFSMKYISSEEFSDNSIFYRHVYVGLWAHFALYKYISCWLLTEASCIRFGLSYSGKMTTETGQVSMWDGCNNIKLKKFEGATLFHHYVESFNCNTNHFALEYIYKRLKFLGNRNLSQLFTLLFLAVWHGVRSGYYVTFFNEFLLISMEKGVRTTLVKTELYHKIWENPISKWILYSILKLYTIVFMGWSLVPFDLKVVNKWLPVYSSLYFSGFVLFMPSFFYQLLLEKLIKSGVLKTVKKKD